MEAMRETVIKLTLSTPEVIRAIKAAFPHDLNIQTLPLNPSARGHHLTAQIVGACGLHIIYKKETTVPAPAPIVDELDPA